MTCWRHPKAMPIDPRLILSILDAHRHGNDGRPNSRVAWNMLRIQTSSADDHLRICVLGAAGSGKSSLIDELCENRSDPRPSIGVRTDCTDWSSEHFDPPWYKNNPLAFIDAPGHGTDAHPTSEFAWLPCWRFDVILFVISSKVMREDETIWALLLNRKQSNENLRIRVVRNMSDTLGRPEDRRAVLDDLCSKFPDADEGPIFTFAAETNGEGIAECREWLLSIAAADR